MEIITNAYYFIITAYQTPKDFLLFYFPIILLIELPIYIIIILGALNYALKSAFSRKRTLLYQPKVSCIVACYNEEKALIFVVNTLKEQLYRGHVEIVLVLDGANTNPATKAIAQQCQKNFTTTDKRTLKVIEKKTRGGHASSINLGIKFCTGELVIKLDGDCICDNDMVQHMVNVFQDKDVIASTGVLRVSNVKENFLTRFQAIEYLIGIQLARLSFNQFNYINLISSAFAGFNKRFIQHTTGWHNGSAEDLDITIRLQGYLAKHKNLKIKHCAKGIVHTKAPSTIKKLFKQRLRWDGDLYYIYISRHKQKISPGLLRLPTFIFILWSGLIMHMVLPFLIIFSFVYLALFYHLSFIAVVFLLTYLYYLVINTLLYSIFIVFVSERKKSDLGYFPLLVFMPFYMAIVKVIACIALLAEILIKSHKDSTMAPSWINRKVK
ncbi:glycosyltransferase family 2 protein [Facilibium subflavum]|uniref:glycosyltransferase family 2 protein n=1 Tax=Facilibium subflavum TaxID=2219058 RepID=UPI000E658461|nr:glycosyltransferase family 2 protein [Facilibium subflavum]